MLKSAQSYWIQISGWGTEGSLNVLKMIVVNEMAYGDLCCVSQDIKAPQDDDKVQFSEDTDFLNRSPVSSHKVCVTCHSSRGI